MSIVFGQDSHIIQWVSRELGGLYFDPSMCAAVGIAHNSNLVAGIVYNNLQMRPGTVTPYAIEMTIASVDKRWCTRHNLRILFAYPFRQLKLKRVQATCARNNKKVRMFLLRLGFRFEGITRESWPFGGDSAVYSMLEPECKWLVNEQIVSRSSSTNGPLCGSCGTNAVE